MTDNNLLPLLTIGIALVTLIASFVLVPRLLPALTNRFGKQAQTQAEATLDSAGVRMAGYIVNRYDQEATDANDSDANHYFFMVAYNVDGKVYRRECRVTPNHYTQYEEGHPVEVEYLPDNPKVSRVVGIPTLK